MGRNPDLQYSVATPNSWSVRIAGRVRRRMFERFLGVTRPGPRDRMLDVGVTADREHDHSNYFEQWYEWKHNITAVGVDHAAFLVRVHPGLKFSYADGRRLPFVDGAFDWVHSSAVIEHVGGAAEQRRFLGELYRVSRRGVFVTTPNRWFPVEMHTLLPFVHWLPKRLFRACLRALGLSFFADEANLNPLGRRELLGLCAEAGIERAEVQSARILGWPSNLLLILRRGRSG